MNVIVVTAVAPRLREIPDTTSQCILVLDFGEIPLVRKKRSSFLSRSHQTGKRLVTATGTTKRSFQSMKSCRRFSASLLSSHLLPELPPLRCPAVLQVWRMFLGAVVQVYQLSLFLFFICHKKHVTFFFCMHEKKSHFYTFTKKTTVFRIIGKEAPAALFLRYRSIVILFPQLDLHLALSFVSLLKGCRFAECLCVCLCVCVCVC